MKVNWATASKSAKTHRAALYMAGERNSGNFVNKTWSFTG
jgi:hypothetical protein